MIRDPSPRARKVALAWLIPLALASSAALAGDAPSTPASGFEAGFAAFATAPLPHVVADGAVDVTRIAPAASASATDAVAQLGAGKASFYASRFAGRSTASGERYDPAQFTAAHRTLPFGSLVRVTNPRTGQQVIVRINDRGPFGHGRVIDLSRAAAEQLGLVRAGVGEVELDLIAE